MKKFAKVSLIISGVLFATGVIILIICSIFVGGKMRSELSDTVSSKLHGIFGIDFVSFAVPWNFDYSHNADVHTGSYSDDKAAAASDITELYLSLGDGKFTIAPSNDEYFHIRSSGKGKCQYYTESSTFCINAFYGSKWYRKNSLTLEIPDKKFNDIDITVGAGSVNISSLKSSKTAIEVGAGELIIGNLSCDDIEASIGMGSVVIEDGRSQDADFDIGMGAIAYTGSITRNLATSVDMGSIELMLNDSQYDHNYEINIDMGSITLGNTEYGGFLDYEQNIDNRADSTYSLECDMGSIDVKFKDMQ